MMVPWCPTLRKHRSIFLSPEWRKSGWKTEKRPVGSHQVYQTACALTIVSLFPLQTMWFLMVVLRVVTVAPEEFLFPQLFSSVFQPFTIYWNLQRNEDSKRAGVTNRWFSLSVTINLVLIIYWNVVDCNVFLICWWTITTKYVTEIEKLLMC